MEIFQYLVDHFSICWKKHANASVPRFNEEAINVYEFNHDRDEPLRGKDHNIYAQEDKIMLHWECQEEWWTKLSGMKAEITRWAKYWIEEYKRETGLDVEEDVIIKVEVEDRDGIKHDSFIIKIKR